MLIPILDRLYIIPIEDSIKHGNLYIPEIAKQKCDQGIVKYRGPQVKNVRVGDHVFFGGYVGTRMAIEDEGIIYVMQEKDIDAIYVDSQGTDLFSLEEVRLKIIEGIGQLRLRDIFTRNTDIELVENVLLSHFENRLLSEGMLF